MKRRLHTGPKIKVQDRQKKGSKVKTISPKKKNIKTHAFQQLFSWLCALTFHFCAERTDFYCQFECDLLLLVVQLIFPNLIPIDFPVPICGKNGWQRPAGNGWAAFASTFSKISHFKQQLHRDLGKSPVTPWVALVNLSPTLRYHPSHQKLKVYIIRPCWREIQWFS